MIIVASRPGQLGNMLVVYANLLAYSCEHQVRIVNPAFWKYRHYFRKLPGWRTLAEKWFFFLVYYKARVLHRSGINTRFAAVKHLDWHEKLDLDDMPAEQLPKIFLLQGWQIRAGELLQRHAATIRRYFTPRGKYVGQLDTWWQENIPAGSTVAGIHVRRGDYKKFEAGKYYYDVRIYAQIMQHIFALLGTEQLVFVISSNEEISPQDLPPGLRTVRAPGHELLDMYALARCHYIAGPPSTYSMWASFYGEVPLYMIKDPQLSFSRNDFIIQQRF